jgi:GNAT superfamily N-acetyltransferase
VGAEPLIRDAAPSDLPALREVRRRASLTNEGDRAWLAAHPEALEYEFVRGGRTRVAAVDGRVVGFATVLADRELEDLFVDPDWMRRGIATALVRDAGAPLTVTANLHALAFYERVGFVAEGAVDTPGGPALRMRLAERVDVKLGRAAAASGAAPGSGRCAPASTTSVRDP